MKNVLKLITLMLVLVMMLGALASCGGPNADPEKAEKALEGNDYEVIVADSKAQLLVYGLDDLDCVITAWSEEDEDEVIMIFYFENKEAASDAFDSDIFEALVEQADKKGDDLIVKASGKMIYIGTKNAIKAAK